MQDTFPYAWTEERGVPRFLRVRAEGLPLREAIWNGVGYLRKYAVAKWTAPVEEVRYFGEQRRLLRALSQGPDPGVRVALVGDLMWLRDSWDTFLSPELLDYLNGHDLVFGNLETPISSRSKVPGFWPDYFTYNSDPRLVTSFRRPPTEGEGRGVSPPVERAATGGLTPRPSPGVSHTNTFTALATANNHSLDRGDAGLGDTLAFLDHEGIAHSGVRASSSDRPWVCVEAGGIRVGFYAACWGLNNPAALRSSRWHVEVLEGLAPQVRLPPQLDRLRAVLADMAREGIDFIIVCLHWGHEFEFYPTPQLMQVGHAILHAGADVILGCHPHVVQPIEVLPIPDGRQGLIAYSLGNFATAMYTWHCRTGLVLSLRLARNEQGRVEWRRPEPRFVFNEQRPRRRLVLLDNYLREHDRNPKLRRWSEFLHRHLLG